MSEPKWKVAYDNTADRWVITDEAGAMRFTGTTEYALTTLAFRLQERDRIKEQVEAAIESLNRVNVKQGSSGDFWRCRAILREVVGE